MISIGNREWEAIKQSEDKGMKEILGLGDYGQKMTDIIKEYLNTIWKKRKLNKKGQKNRAKNQNTEDLETRKHGDHNYYKAQGSISNLFFFIFYYPLVSCFFIK